MRSPPRSGYRKLLHCPPRSGEGFAPGLRTVEKIGRWHAVGKAVAMSSAHSRKILFLDTIGDLFLIGFALGCIALLVAFTGEPHAARLGQGGPVPVGQVLHTERHMVQD